MKRAMRLMVTGVVLFVAVHALAQDEQAQSSSSTAQLKTVVPRLIRFSGRVQEASGKPVQGVTDITFSLYREDSGGEPLWFETQTVELDAQGRYNVLLGAMHPDGLPMELFTSGEARWLGIMVDSIEQPRVLLVSVPYALKAGDAMTGTLNLPANGLVAGTNQLVLSGGKVGIGTSNPGRQLSMTGVLGVSAGAYGDKPVFIETASGNDQLKYAGRVEPNELRFYTSAPNDSISFSPNNTLTLVTRYGNVGIGS